ncbi:hypothetical protein J3B02_002183 [Coemansia erecta]|nr:hypothetical protein J3B02_002183 [Coemansia erecta]
MSGITRLSDISCRRLALCHALPKTLPVYRSYSMFSNALSPYIKLSSSVERALDNGEPVVALESTIISHGMPYPQNVETAQQVERIVADNGSTPATVALIDGKIHVGLCESELDLLGKAGKTAVKTSRRDMAAVLSQRLLGATTVSGTMIAAHMAGIRIFATGGIGGVHRGAELTMDVSADLTELGRTPVAVVCAGAKSILDLPKTLEYLETQGVPVIAFGKEKEFPAFFRPRSGLMAPWNLETPEKVAALTRSSLDIGLKSGIVVAVPIPEQYAEDAKEFEQAISAAVRESEIKGINGKESTPFLLKRVAELTGGSSLAANIALVKNNAMVASQIAKSLSSISILSMIIKLGEKGAAIVSPSPKTPTLPLIRSIRPLKPSLIINSNGAGDSMVGAVLASLLIRKVQINAEGHIDLGPQEFDTIVNQAQKASILSLESSMAISEKLEPGLLKED